MCIDMVRLHHQITPNLTILVVTSPGNRALWKFDRFESELGIKFALHH